MSTPPVISEADLEAVVCGVSLLGSGGGGDAAAFARVLGRRLAGGALTLRDPASFTGGYVVPVGVVGATSVFTEKLPGGQEFSAAVDAVLRWTGRQASAVMALEAGGLNGVTAMVAALELGVPLLDADLMGRALPRLDQFSWAVQGLPVTPCALREPSGQVIVIDAVDAAGLERSARAFLAEAGGWAAIALPPTRIEEAVSNAVVGSLGRALALGRAHVALPDTPSRAEVESALDATVLAVGRIVDVARMGQAGHFGRGSVTLVDPSTGEIVRVEAENEYLLALVDGDPAASTPDLICLLDRRTAAPISVDRVRVGDEAIVAVLPGPAWWRAEDRLPYVSPAAFGLQCEPVDLRRTR